MSKPKPKSSPKPKAPKPSQAKANRDAMKVNGSSDPRSGNLGKLADFRDELEDTKAHHPAYQSPEQQKAIDDQIARVDRAIKALEDENQARKDLDDAYKAAGPSDPEADPKVKELKKAVNDQAKQVHEALPPSKKGPVANLVQSCNKAVAKAWDPDVPRWNKSKYGEGPAYPVTGQRKLKNYPGWDDLVNREKIKTTAERHSIGAVGTNEGDLDSVQGYDSEVVSLGSMQKTMNKKGEGELPAQIEQFQKENPEKYKELFEDKGWSVRRDTITKTVKDKKGKTKTSTHPSEPRLYYTDPENPDAGEMTGKELKQYIDDKDDPKKSQRALQPMRDAGRDPAYQRRQVLDFNNRLRTAVGKNPSNHDHPISKYTTSERGAALVLDQSVNRPGNVSADFGKALDKFYAAHAKDAEPPDADPDQWPADKRQAYEDEILKNYAGDPDSTPPVAGTRRMNDAAARNKSIGNDSDISSDAGSMSYP